MAKHKFTQLTLERMANGLRMGMNYDHACRYAGISPSTLNDWRQGGIPQSVSKKFAIKFFEDLERAEADGTARLLTIINRSAQGNAELGLDPDWKAAAWILERRFPEDYGRVVTRMEHVNAKDEPLEISVRIPKMEQMLEKLDMEGLEALNSLMSKLKSSAEVSQTTDNRHALDSGAVEAEYVEVG